MIIESGKTTLNALAFQGWTKSEFKEKYASILGGDTENVWKQIQKALPKKKVSKTEDKTEGKEGGE